MAALTLDALLRSLKKGAPPPETVYLLYGDEDVLKDEAVRMLVDAAVGSSRDFNLDVRYASDLSPESFHALVNTPPMLAEHRAVVIRGDRKSTRLNSSHMSISYAVFCLKKKK